MIYHVCMQILACAIFFWGKGLLFFVKTQQSFERNINLVTSTDVEKPPESSVAVTIRE